MRAGIFQCTAGGWSAQQRLDQLASALEQQTLDVVLCPELFASGYHIGASAADQAEAQNGPFFQGISELARRQNTAIIYGYPERDGEKIYNSAACVDSRGELTANHRKLVLPPGYESEVFTPGKQLTLFSLLGIRCAILICYDAELPEAVRAVTEAGAEVLFVPTALTEQWGVVAYKVIPSRAFENGSWLLYANHAGAENELNYLGSSVIVSPHGQDVIRAGEGQQLISAEIDIQQVTQARDRLPYLQNVVQLRKMLDR